MATVLYTVNYEIKPNSMESKRKMFSNFRRKKLRKYIEVQVPDSVCDLVVFQRSLNAASRSVRSFLTTSLHCSKELSTDSLILSTVDVNTSSSFSVIFICLCC